MTTTLSAKAKNVYLDLVRLFPLRVIRTENESVAANDVLLKLILSKPRMNPGEREYIEALTALIRQYEESAANSEVARSSPLELLRHLMDETHMTVTGLGRVIGHQPTASQILRGERQLSKSHIQKLAGYFNLSPALFMDRPSRDFRQAS